MNPVVFSCEFVDVQILVIYGQSKQKEIRTSLPSLELKNYELKDNVIIFDSNWR